MIYINLSAVLGRMTGYNGHIDEQRGMQNFRGFPSNDREDDQDCPYFVIKVCCN